MNAFRHYIHRRRWWAAAFVVAALLIEILVPAGYMPTMTNGAFLMRPCAGQDAPIVAMVVGSSDSAMHADHKNVSDPANELDPTDHSGLATHCVFSSLSAPTLGPIDPILLAIAIAIVFMLVTAFQVEHGLVLWRGIHLRPPSQGPPATP